MTLPRQGVHTASELRRSTRLGCCLAGVDQILGYPDPIASDAAQLIAAYANVDQSITASSVMLRLSVKQRERFEDLVTRAGL